MSQMSDLGVWFPTVRTGTGTDVFTERLVAALFERGIRAEITWLPLRAEYAPWSVSVPKPPAWAIVAHVNTWLHSRFLPKHLPIVATIHHSVHHPEVQSYKGPVRAAYHRLWIAPNERRVMRRVDQVVAVSRFVAETARQSLGEAPIKVIYNGVDTQCFRPGNCKRQSDEPFRLLYVGSWMARKGVDMLAPILRELGGGFELHYTGGESVHAGEKERMPPNMHDIGRLSDDGDVVAAMQNADTLLLPSRSEGFGLVAAEAMACGLPVIATRCSSLPEVIDHPVTGMLCEPDDIGSFINAVRQLHSNASQLNAMGQLARSRVLRLFSEDQMCDAHLKLYARLTGI